MTIRTKAELLVLYADNVSGDISASDLRDFVDSNQVALRQTTSTTPISIAVSTDVVISNAGSSVINLPDLASYGNRSLSLLNLSGGSLTVNAVGSDTILGVASIVIIVNQIFELSADSSGTNWIIINSNRQTFLSATDTPSTYSGAANQHATVNVAETDLVFTDAVDSFIGRTGVVVAAASDYDASQVDNDSTVTGAFVDNALNQLDTDITGKPDDFLELTDTPGSYSGAANQVVAVNSGETALEFTTPGDSSISFDANDAIFPATDPAVADSRNAHPILAFDNTTAESVIFNSSMGENYSGGDIDIHIDWVAETATTGGVTWGVEVERIAPGGTDIDSDSFDTQQTGTSTTNVTSGVVTRTTITLTQAEADGITALDAYRLRVERVTGDGGDTMTDDAQILRLIWAS